MQNESNGMLDGQMRRVGMADQLTPALREKLRDAPGAVEHSFTQNYGEDRANVTLHFRKGREKDAVFLNKFDMTVENANNAIKQTFYTPPEVQRVSRPDGQTVRYDNKYTMKEAYNLLSGRPVFKHLVAKDGKPYQAWVKMTKEKVMENGNHELKQYNMNYGFNLDNVLKQYSIKELANPQYKQNLLESLERGNLQKVTFVGTDGKEQPLYISPSITTSSLNVFDDSKKRVSLERLVSDGLIADSLVATLKEKFGQKNRDGIGPSNDLKSQTEKVGNTVSANELSSGQGNRQKEVAKQDGDGARQVQKTKKRQGKRNKVG